jgi:hypothetical protein
VLAGLLTLRELARALQLDRGAGERVREHVMELGCDSPSLRDGRCSQLFLACVLELCKQEFRLGLAGPRPLDEIGDEAEQRAQQDRRENRGGGAPVRRPSEREPGGDRGRDGRAEWQLQARHAHPYRGAARKLGRAARLQRRQRDAGRPHDRDARGLRPPAPVDEAPADRECERNGKRAQRERDADRPSVQSGRRVGVDRAHENGGHGCDAERTQSFSLASKALLGTRARVRHPRALAPRDSAHRARR